MRILRFEKLYLRDLIYLTVFQPRAVTKFALKICRISRYRYLSYLNSTFSLIQTHTYIHIHMRVMRYSVQPASSTLKSIYEISLPATELAVLASIALPQPVTAMQRFNDTYRSIRGPDACSRTKRLSDERVSATAGHRYHVVARRGCRVRWYRRVSVAI